MISKPITRLVAIRHQPLRVGRPSRGRHRNSAADVPWHRSRFELLQSLVDAPRSGIDIIRFDVPGVGGSAHGGNSRARTDDVRRLFWANPL